MYITRIELKDFRNIESWELEPQRALTVLVGQNAAGKTNTIEALQVLCTGESFRRPRWADLVRWDAPFTHIAMSVEGELPTVDVSLAIDSGGQRSWRVGGIQKRRASEAVRFAPVVAFTPDDLSMVKGPAEHRRATLDSLGEQLSVVYGVLRRDYARVVRQRNSLLRDGSSRASLEPWDIQLIALGARLYTHRRRLLKKVAEEMRPVYAELSGGEALDVELADRCGIGNLGIDQDIDQQAVGHSLGEYLASRSRDECERGVTLVGPHRDDVVFTIEGRAARSFASQGQQRTIALAWKLAEVGVVTSVLSKAPILLLDDVMSELDSTRRAALTDLIQKDIQTFVTTTNTGYFDPELLSSALVVPVGVGA
ncbi:MAG: DNA replication/repair protein RecF [Coriobacteriia bacterium]|nr:DNA replication/repair protein RecF [Coriobacteriia bacterium]MBN2841043.1 DNA replication/repair protein RecF [Coriobacteriia bacterium]